MMIELADIGLIKTVNNFFRQNYKSEGIEVWPFTDYNLKVITYTGAAKTAPLKRCFKTAVKSGCSLMAMPPQIATKVNNQPLSIANGRLYALAVLPKSLDYDCPGWRKDSFSLNADDSICCLAARFLAPLIKQLHIYGQDDLRRAALAKLIYRENGLIVEESKQPKPSSFIIIAPDKKELALEAKDNYLWQNWAKKAITAKDKIIDSHLAEALLIAKTNYDQKNQLALLANMHRRSHYYHLLPVKA